MQTHDVVGAAQFRLDWLESRLATRRFLPVGPVVDWTAPHDRGRLT